MYKRQVYAILKAFRLSKKADLIAATTVENYRKLKDAGIGTYILFQETCLLYTSHTTKINTILHKLHFFV